jgi:hypothetical protein
LEETVIQVFDSQAAELTEEDFEQLTALGKEKEVYKDV